MADGGGLVPVDLPITYSYGGEVRYIETFIKTHQGMLEINGTSSHSLCNISPTVIHPLFRIARAISFIRTFTMVRVVRVIGVKDLGGFPEKCRFTLWTP